jgi:LytS/YehU family sensor histidine kinase
VRVTAARTGSLLRLAVENDIDEDLAAAPGTGIGLANVRQRLAAAYGHEASIHWTRGEHTFRVELALPAETKENH